MFCFFRGVRTSHHSTCRVPLRNRTWSVSSSPSCLEWTCSSSRLDVQQKHEERGVDEHAVDGTDLAQEETVLFLAIGVRLVQVRLQVALWHVRDAFGAFRSARSTLGARQAQLLHACGVHLARIPGRRRVLRPPVPSIRIHHLHGHLSDLFPGAKAPRSAEEAMANGMAVADAHRIALGFGHGEFGFDGASIGRTEGEGFPFGEK
eukprot:scaffold684_cov345-Pavlova_lutheri.AAC.51